VIQAKASEAIRMPSGVPVVPSWRGARIDGTPGRSQRAWRGEPRRWISRSCHSDVRRHSGKRFNDNHSDAQKPTAGRVMVWSRFPEKSASGEAEGFDFEQGTELDLFKLAAAQRHLASWL